MRAEALANITELVVGDGQVTLDVVTTIHRAQKIPPHTQCCSVCGGIFCAKVLFSFPKAC